MLQNRNSAGMLAGQASLRGLTPLIGITAAATAALLYWIVGEPVFAAGFAAAIIAIAALAFYFKKLFPPTRSAERGVGRACVSPFGFGWSPTHEHRNKHNNKKNNQKNTT